MSTRIQDLGRRGARTPLSRDPTIFLADTTHDLAQDHEVRGDEGRGGDDRRRDPKQRHTNSARRLREDTAQLLTA